MSDRLLTARDIADRLNVNRETVLRWTRRGKLPGFRMPSGQLRYREEEITAWLQVRATQETGANRSNRDAALASSHNGSSLTFGANRRLATGESTTEGDT